MKNKSQNIVEKNQVILNLIQDLQRLPLLLLNNLRGRCQIKFGMTILFNNGGFTLIELLVVVLIIGILAAVAVPQYQKAVYKSRFSNLKTLAHSLAQAQERYYLANSTYATKLNQLDINIPNDSSNNNQYNVSYFKEGYCAIQHDTIQSAVYCRNTAINMKYQIYLKHSKHNPNLRACITYNRNKSSLQNQVCQLETGTKTGYNTDTNSLLYWF